MSRILDGAAVGRQIRSEVAERVAELKRQGIRPGLAAVLVGENPASTLYVKNKAQTCADLGIYSRRLDFSATISTSELVDQVRALNNDDAIDGILVQLPLPPHVQARSVLNAVDPWKDVDGFHPENVGKLCANVPGLVPCTPAGIMELLKRERIEISGREAVVIGRSDIVGKPLALLLLHRNATVTICHSKTADLPGVSRRADLLFAAMGRPGFVSADFVKPGAVLVDVGINRIVEESQAERFFAGTKRMDDFRAKGSILLGDVHPEAHKVAAAYTPVPGGVGPLTIAMLMANTVQAAMARRGLV
ncbi:MAG: bifunctional 5,10-methylenetetrahydrofolate dehydrogenase/5,10-methenyltetrahydrofolate cyclohydrolase [Acidobacteria bacterium]|nr:bifunctional 5,10-methylenetetrahydrofolate dehydrogenase/5,10-methenyltetrahydrofolate cyclohydrolase [Acidobacteriota bacterium]